MRPCSACIRSPDDANWKGWWGDEPPFGTPVYVLTHNAAPVDPDARRTTFHFRNAAVEDVLAEAADAAGGLDVRVGGGVRTAGRFCAPAWSMNCTHGRPDHPRPG